MENSNEDQWKLEDDRIKAFRGRSMAHLRTMFVRESVMFLSMSFEADCNLTMEYKAAFANPDCDYTVKIVHMRIRGSLESFDISVAVLQEYEVPADYMDISNALEKIKLAS